VPAGERTPAGVPSDGGPATAVEPHPQDTAPPGGGATPARAGADPADAVSAPDRRRLPVPSRTLLAVLAGLAMLLAFPGSGLVPLAVLGPAFLALAVHGTRARAGAWLGLVTGLVFFVPLLSWSGIYVGPVPWLALAVSQALFVSVLGAATAVVSRLPGWPVWTAALWVALEAARGRVPFGGFPWGRLGFSQTDGPLMSFAAYGGVPLVSFAVALTGALLALSALRLGAAWRAAPGDRRPGPLGRAAAAAVVGVLAVPLVGAVAWLPLAGPSLTAGGEVATVALVQGDVPRAGLDFNAQRRAVLDNHVQRTLELAQAVEAGDQPRPDLVIWPENSSDIDPYVNEDAARQIDRAAEAVGVPILVGAVVVGPGDFISNTAIVWDPEDGPGDTYVKRHPVPFAEYIPYRSFFRIFSKEVDRVRRDFAAGDEVGVLDVGGVRLGDLICFEVVYDGLVDDVVDRGAGMLVVQTNNATFGYTDESAQQLALSRLRAVEHGRSVAIAATSGISAVVAPDGTVVRRTSLFTPAVVVADIAQRDSRTVATRLGAGPEWVLTAVGAVALVAAVVLGRRPGRRR
jgi:apolipoprotein N-acyltransferase